MFRRFLIIVLTVVTILTAGWLALRRPDIPYEMLELKYAFSDSRYATLQNGTRVHYRDVGPRRAETIVLVHGFSASVHTWTDWISDLRKSYRVIALDLPGHGLTRVTTSLERLPDLTNYVTVVDEVMDSLDVESFVLVGSSMGGGVAWNYTLDHADRVDGLVLVDAAGWPDTGDGDDDQLIFRLLENQFARGIIKDLDLSSLVADGLRDSFADPTLVDDDMVRRYVELSRAPGHRDILLYLSAARQDRREASDAVLSGIRTPTLVMHGELDRLIPVEHGRQFHEAIAGSQLIVYPNVGHIPQEEIPDQSVSDLISFVRGIYEVPDESEIIISDNDVGTEQLPN